MSTSALPAAQAEAKPPVSHETIDATGCGPAMKAALHLVLDGVRYREAAREVGLASHQASGDHSGAHVPPSGSRP